MAKQTKILITSEEFEALPESQQPTELIEGEIVVRGVPTIRHQRVVRNIFKLLDNLASNGEVLFAPVSIKLNDTSYYQPDVLWIGDDNPNCEIDEGGIDGAPDLVVEVISTGTAKIDRGIKFDTYQQAGVREYWIVEPEENFVEVWQLIDAVYTKLGLFTVEQRFTSPMLTKEIPIQDIFQA
jgi:Uma2 family endonuclease